MKYLDLHKLVVSADRAAEKALLQLLYDDRELAGLLTFLYSVRVAISSLKQLQHSRILTSAIMLCRDAIDIDPLKHLRNPRMDIVQVLLQANQPLVSTTASVGETKYSQVTPALQKQIAASHIKGHIFSQYLSSIRRVLTTITGLSAQKSYDTINEKTRTFLITFANGINRASANCWDLKELGLAVDKGELDGFLERYERFPGVTASDLAIELFRGLHGPIERLFAVSDWIVAGRFEREQLAEQERIAREEKIRQQEIDAAKEEERRKQEEELKRIAREEEFRQQKIDAAEMEERRKQEEELQRIAREEEFRQNEAIRLRKKMTKIFISYRREDSNSITHRLASKLREKYGKDAVFIDVDDLKGSQNYQLAIENALSNVDICLSIIGPRWIPVSEWVERELVIALDKVIPIVPVLVEEAAMPLVEKLPPSIVKLALRQGEKLDSAQHFEHTFHLLTQVINKIKTERHEG